MQEREFQNMFTFYPDFEAATLKIPMSGSTSDGEEPAASSAVRKQIIGFAKFRTRAAAQEARNILTGRKVDAEKNCILKAEMAKKNLHTKRGLASNGAGVASSAGFPASSSVPNGFAIPLTRSVNSNDQNPPCNTLYVGNLPMNTAEEELRGLFTQALGYKRLCFRPKPNAGPICFVEFEDVAYATQAMRELDGHPISSSTNGGIRLSFSKNPLGVRQATPTNTTSLNMMGSLPVLGGSYPLNLAALKAASHTPPPSASSLFGSSLGSRHAPGLDHSLGLEPTSAAIH
ncbi:hypothetical protein BJ085DRAFT_13386 [Dimargaris cristalligena]|uniref:RRM domain-containing protein n=1 Tax=Dimargaris cristalligena TaxID=215637 RepID=A0A4P9ZWF2_9FUNG|nr:hypothetical protein BJ085DRAFT_13386 [Dimargaris cristalligena]|eukprot:RKP37010.1 hypothetical protein BJ085DRAFT_13386 [Dimargaris cristalligena]